MFTVADGAPLVIGAETHYDATITVYRLFTETGYQPLAEFDGNVCRTYCLKMFLKIG